MLEIKLELLKNKPYYTKILDILAKLEPQNILPRLNSNCVAASDLIQNLLHQHGIQSKIIEVQLTATKHYDNGSTEFLFLGYDNLAFPGQLDTHLIVITDTDIPLLIDTSIGTILQSTDQKFVCYPLNSTDNLLADYKFNDVQLTYQQKKSVKYPLIHQRNLLEKLSIEQKTQDTLYWLKKLTILGLGLSIFNMIANTVLIVLKMMYL